jgi:very-short-patch-repair endonuclease
MIPSPGTPGEGGGGEASTGEGQPREHPMAISYNRSERLREFSRELRQNQTDAEQRIWTELRGRRFAGVKFRRQVPIGQFIVDFLSVRKNLVIELDGGQHYDPAGRARDAKRDEYLRLQGLNVLRFSDYDVLKNTEMVLHRILVALEGPHP